MPLNPANGCRRPLELSRQHEPQIAYQLRRSVASLARKCRNLSATYLSVSLAPDRRRLSLRTNNKLFNSILDWLY